MIERSVTLPLHELRSVAVLVAGGGVAGVYAALGAADHGARVLLVEQHGFVGGQGTAGGVHTFCGETRFVNDRWREMLRRLSARQEADRQARRARVTGRWSADQVSRFSGIWRRWDGGPILAATRLPVLEIYGDRGRAAPTREALGIPARGNVDLQVIAGASHYLHVERPDEVAQACRRFLASVAASSPARPHG